MSADRPTGGSALALQRVSGLVFIAVLIGLVGLTIALYQKAFQPVVEVTLQADRAGNQLNPPADVKVRGVIVGEAREVQATEDGAVITLALEPSEAELLPTNVSARLLPKTLFGERYVELVLPEDPSGETLADGDVIPQDRSETARELSAALDGALPLLRTLRPEELSVTLNAVSSALRGRGDRIGSNLVLARDYFAQFNRELPTLQEDFRGLADFTDNLDAAAPDFLRVLDNLSFINRSLVDTEDELARFLTETTGSTRTFEDFLDENDDRFIRLAAESVPNLALYAEYSPEFPCLADGLVQSREFISDTFGVLQPGLHITLEFVENQGGYDPNEDEPQYLDDRGPDCFGLPSPEGQADDFNFLDGFRDDLPRSTTQREEEPDNSAPEGPEGQRAALNAVVAPVLGVSTRDVPDVAHLLFGPVARGTVVGLATGRSPADAS
jgi:phospholipid/cholesterol/gamma-HCH transport system substrate-binding protein